MLSNENVKVNSKSISRPYEQLASEFISAIKAIANNLDNLENFESYLSLHFGEWMIKYAGDPEGITSELKIFAGIE